MRKGWISFLSACILFSLIAVFAPDVKAAGHANHCVCGNSAAHVQEHSCENISWKPLSVALKAKKMTADTANFGKLPAGNYYLDADITVTGLTDITQNISLCLNGHTISRQEGKIFGYLKGGYTLNICDCSGTQDADGNWSWQGSIVGGSYQEKQAGILYTHAGSLVNLYGGNFTAHDGVKGGLFIVAHDGCGDVDGDGQAGTDADKAQAPTAVLNFYNGNITGCDMVSGKTLSIYHGAAIYWYGGRLTGGSVNGVPQKVYCLEGNRLASVAYGSVSEAMKKLTEGQNLKLVADVEENYTLTKSVLLDLNGHKLSGVTLAETLYVHDTGNGQGRLQYSVTGEGRLLVADEQQLAVKCADGTAFYRGNAQITKISLSPEKAAFGYKAVFTLSESLRAEIASYGYELWLEGASARTYSTNKPLTDSTELTLRLNNILKTDNALLENYNRADMQINARPFIRLRDGSKIAFETQSYDLRQMMELADSYYTTFNQEQTDALQQMYSRYETIMLGWDMPNIIHASGWQEVDAASLGALLKYHGTYTLNGEDRPEYRIPTGKYRLTEDVDLQQLTVGDGTVPETPTIRIHSGTNVTICLNGHSILTDSRVFKVYGTLNICDCSDHEGAVISGFSGNKSAYAPIAYVYNGTMNLYSGNLISTGTISSAGCIAVGKSGNTTGTLNVFGGTISGGRATGNSGLIALWDGSSINMYGGKLSGGYAGEYGGALTVGSGAKACLYGGEICDNQAHGRGGGIYATSGETVLHLGDRLTVNNNVAAEIGGNVYCNSDLGVSLDGASITHGQAGVAGGMYTSSGTVRIQGDALIRDNENGNLYLPASVALEDAGLLKTAQVYLYNVSAMAVSLQGTSQAFVLERSGYQFATVGGRTVLIPEGFVIPTDVEGFQVGYGRMDISPQETGLPLAGYGNAADRLSQDTCVNEYDRLQVSTVAVTDEAGQTVLLISADLIRPSEDLINSILPAVTASTGVPESNIFITFTHTHSAPETKNTTDPKIQRYNAMLPDRFAQSANDAMADRALATMEMGSFEVDGLSFTRHYTYQDDNGIWQYFGDNFGTATYNSTTKHVTEADRTMHLVKFTRDGTDVLMANWRVHPHMTGSGTETRVSADIIGTTRYYLEKNQDVHFIYLQGAAGNVNEKSKLAAENHGLKYLAYGKELAEQIQAAMEISVLESVDAVGTWQVDHYRYTAQSDIATKEEYDHARAARETYNAWLAENSTATSRQKLAKCEELGYQSWFHFNNVITRYGLNQTYQLPLNTFSLGSSLAFFTAPGELWDTVSMEVEGSSPFAMTMCMGYCMDHFNYFVYDPDNGGQMTYESYEGNNYRFVAPTTINEMIAYWKQTLDQLYSNLKSAA